MAGRKTKAFEARIAALLAYCRISQEELDASELALLMGMYDAARSYLTQSGVAEPAADGPRRAQYDLMVNALVLDAYDRRDMTLTGCTVQESPAFRRILNQLKLSEPVSAGDAGEGEG